MLKTRFMVLNSQRLLNRLRNRILLHRKAVVVVGYTAFYSVWVHENLAIDHSTHSCGGQAKFLEQPVSALRPIFGRIVLSHMRRGMTLLRALLLVGFRLQVSAQLLTPVDTGLLKASAFTRED